MRLDLNIQISIERLFALESNETQFVEVEFAFGLFVVSVITVRNWELWFFEDRSVRFAGVDIFLDLGCGSTALQGMVLVVPVVGVAEENLYNLDVSYVDRKFEAGGWILKNET